MSTTALPDHRILPKTKLDDLFALLQGDGFEVVGPRIDQGAIVYGPIRCADELPIGWTDRQAPGSYRLERRADQAYFGYAVGPHSWKKYLFPPVLRLWQARRQGQGFEVTAGEPDPPRRAFLGIRACELRALAVQDRAFINRADQWSDPHYAKARARLFLVAVECEQPAGTCFCASMGTGPEVNGASPFDLALTELDDAFLVRAGSPAGEAVRDRLGLAKADRAQAVRLMTAAFILTGLRVKKEKLAGIYQGVRIMHESTAYDQAVEEGEIRISHRVLLRQGRKLLGAPDPSTEAALRSIQDVQRLERMTEAILSVKSWQELLATP